MKLFGIHNTWKISTCIGKESEMTELLELSDRNLKAVIKILQQERGQKHP